MNLRSDEGEAEEDARRRRCMRVGSTFGILAATANNERTIEALNDAGIKDGGGTYHQRWTQSRIMAPGYSQVPESSGYHPSRTVDAHWL